MVDRREISKEIFAPFKGKRLAVIGIGGGGDVYSTVPLMLELEREYAARVYPGGLTWKRKIHDSEARPRRIEEFDGVERLNELIALASPESATKDGVRHAEADLSGALGGRQVLMIDPGAGSRAVHKALEDLRSRLGLDAIIGLDVGGDALANGHEPTLESPLCDQTFLWSLAESDSRLVIASLGTDGEMTPADLELRLSRLSSCRAYRGALAASAYDINEWSRITSGAKSESSTFALELTRRMQDSQLSELLADWNAPCPDFAALLRDYEPLALRNGTRCGFVADATSLFLHLDARSVVSTSALREIWNPDLPILEMARVLHDKGIKTEISSPV